MGDYHAVRWNTDFFGDGVSIPAGIFVIPSNVSDKERDRVAEDMNARHGTQRRTAVVRADPGSTVWHNAGLNQQEMDFVGMRKFTRMEVYEALDLPLGYLSETSTEAHARVAERQFLSAVARRLSYVADKFNPEVMQFWRQSSTLAAMFEDPRKDAADWEQMERKAKVYMPIATKNERREMFWLDRMEGLDELPQSGGPSAEDGGGDSDSLQRAGQLQDVVE